MLRAMLAICALPVLRYTATIQKRWVVATAKCLIFWPNVECGSHIFNTFDSAHKYIGLNFSYLYSEQIINNIW